MSDDEEYYDEFDDDDIFWVEEPDPDVADDLAATSTNDPAIPDDPSLEAVEFFSDWDELSDDYYDEDPTVVRRLRAMGAWTNHNEALAAKVDNSPPTKRRKTNAPATDITSFQGVVWKLPTDETDFVQIYAPGEGDKVEKVALLKNWREIFKNANPAIARLRVRSATSGPLASEVDGLDSGDFLPPEPSLDDASTGASSPSVAVEEFRDDGLGSTTSVTDMPSEKTLYSAPVHTSVVVNSPSELPVHSKRVERSAEQELKAESQPSKAPAPSNRKRKASVSLDEPHDQGETTSRPATKTRSKRVASSKGAPAPATSSGPIRRSTRNKK
ncbi:hypothetical protein P175DRAFT_072630 [Aspergillus ochraceoroseus IBT 24754]|uniref:Uncharacterized protein n=3 Tax=Aspergillus subgen. Nidulantes TaxID=2720870 RepID=A0A0F8U819_9EURO|nr:uncharacterized protein P175DRAFT_072630 [Aspergillus ochraceoroseus IBT 24754]KKK15899.1 hypothetical protein ARAM_002872 [Aspergillus rambellii]KKK17195.1 hypothetical protein AOCH_003431 [Aspergillus ochraceoroseus]PTU25279.1 hypothetical protein P175DRAFT_072630 [Aspergillus ochraceoroseus IBT 24754]